MSAFLSKDALTAAAGKLPVERVDLPEIGGHVYVRGMSGVERDAWERSLVVGKGRRRDYNLDNVRARLAARCICDETGVRQFADDDADTLGKIRVDCLNRIFEVAQRLSGVSDQDVDELGKGSELEAGSGSSSN